MRPLTGLQTARVDLPRSDTVNMTFIRRRVGIADRARAPGPHWRIADIPASPVALSDTVARLVDTGMPCIVTRDTYRLPGELTAHADTLADAHTRNRRYVNHAKARLVHLGEHPDQAAVLGIASYRDQILTHENGDALIRGGETGEIDLTALWTAHGTLLPIDACRTANTFGVAVLALSCDRRIVLGRRCGNLAVAPNLWDVTASGGCEPPPGTANPPETLKRYLVGEGLRELSEEATLATFTEAPQARVAAVFRNLRRGGLTDFLLVVKLSEPAERLHAGDELDGYLHSEPICSLSHLAATLDTMCATQRCSANLRVAAWLARASIDDDPAFPHARETFTWLAA